MAIFIPEFLPVREYFQFIFMLFFYLKKLQLLCYPTFTVNLVFSHKKKNSNELDVLSSYKKETKQIFNTVSPSVVQLVLLHLCSLITAGLII